MLEQTLKVFIDALLFVKKNEAFFNHTFIFGVNQDTDTLLCKYYPYVPEIILSTA